MKGDRRERKWRGGREEKEAYLSFYVFGLQWRKRKVVTMGPTYKLILFLSHSPSGENKMVNKGGKHFPLFSFLSP
jgi:hypothetical protein